MSFKRTRSLVEYAKNLKNDSIKGSDTETETDTETESEHELQQSKSAKRQKLGLNDAVTFAMLNEENAKLKYALKLSNETLMHLAVEIKEKNDDLEMFFAEKEHHFCNQIYMSMELFKDNRRHIESLFYDIDCLPNLDVVHYDGKILQLVCTEGLDSVFGHYVDHLEAIVDDGEDYEAEAWLMSMVSALNKLSGKSLKVLEGWKDKLEDIVSKLEEKKDELSEEIISGTEFLRRILERW